jgi:hypothetical protein
VTTFTGGRTGNTVEAREAQQERHVAAMSSWGVAATTRDRLTAAVRVDKTLRDGW